MSGQIAVIIPTYNGAHKIVNLLDALTKQTLLPTEIIIVVDGSTDNTYQVLQGYLATSTLPIKIITQKNSGRASTRNRGAAQAKSDILFFLDDDMRPEPEVLQKHWEFHQKHNNIIIAGPAPEDPRLAQTDVQCFKVYLSQRWANHLPATATVVSKKQPFLAAAHCSMPAHIFNTLEGFDERLTDAEDFDLAVRATIQGIDIYFLPDAKAWHDDFITIRSFIKRHIQYKQAHREILALKPEFYKQFNQYQTPSVNLFKKLAFWCFSFEFWVTLIDKYNFFRILPKAMRYKVYDLVVTSQSVHFPKQNLKEA